MADISFESARWNGPKVVAIGGGHGLASLLRGLKKFTENVTAIVTVADDGGNSGALRNDLGVLPPGDIRNCLLALSNTEPLMESLIDYRFSEGSLKGNSMGNLLIAALNDICGSFSVAVSTMCQLLAVTGQVLPVTDEDVILMAELENGVKVLGESMIAQCKKEEDCGIRRMGLLPESAKALAESVAAIENADMIIYGPGSLYTSIVPNLLVGGICQAVQHSNALKVYVCNVMTQDGETEGYTVSDHIRGLQAHANCHLFDICLANSAPISEHMKEKYAVEGAAPVEVDRDVVKELGIELVERELAMETGDRVRHDPEKVAKELIRLHYRRHDRDDLRRFDRAMVRYIEKL